MSIPTSERVVFQNNPIVEVVCQLSFPPILRIESELPATLQEGIRKDFPEYVESQRSGFQLTMPVGVPSKFSPGTLSTENNKKIHTFVTEDKTRFIVLTSDSVAFVAKVYSDWNDFKGWIKNPLDQFIKEYEPRYFKRIGLRYKDLIVRSKLELKVAEWKDLLVPSIAGELCWEGMDELITGKTSQAVYQIGEYERLVLNHGTVIESKAKEECYLIDCDVSSNTESEVNNAYSVLDRFNGIAGNVFRSCLSKRLREALSPS
ncbi:MAG: TIGR04255 family protein [Aridibacter famidurans]|nr:TIGR04255 family protein [Aridibacter famidurans]